ncbi:hypothetical protein DXG01_009376 [Tephrocybe rancida]|nr:hypothetical protein DXG01_009376 [Tephrocybe rancida]
MVDEDEDTLDVMLYHDKQYDFRSVMDKLLFQGHLERICPGEDPAKWAHCEVLGDEEKEIWCELPPGYRPSTPDTSTFVASTEFHPVLGREYVFSRTDANGYVFDYVGKLQHGLQDGFDKSTCIQQYNNLQDYAIPDGYHAPRPSFMNLSPHPVDDISSDSGSSYDKTSHTKKAEADHRSKRHNATPPQDTAGEDAELNLEFEAETVADGSHTPKHSEKSKGKQHTVDPPDLPMLSPGNSLMLSPFSAFCPLEDSSDDEEPAPQQLSTKGCPAPKAMLKRLEDLRNNTFDTLEEISHEFNGRHSIVSMAKFVFNKPGVSKINSTIVFKEYFAAFPGKFEGDVIYFMYYTHINVRPLVAIETPASAKHLKGKAHFTAKANSAYCQTYGSLTDEQKVAALEFMERELSV